MELMMKEVCLSQKFIGALNKMNIKKNFIKENISMIYTFQCHQIISLALNILLDFTSSIYIIKFSRRYLVSTQSWVRFYRSFNTAVSICKSA